LYFRTREEAVPKKTRLQGKTIRCILFDCGETLWTRNDKATWQALEQAANLQAVALLHKYASTMDLPVVDDEQLGSKMRKAIEKLMSKIRHQHPGYEPDFTTVTQEALIHLGFPKFTRAVADAIFEALRVRIPASRTLFPDVLPTLTTLHERGFLLSLVTNRQWGGTPFVDDLRTLGLLDYLDPSRIAVSANLGIRKPNPLIFTHALNALRVTPAEAIMVGDSLRADIAGANQLGIFAVWKPGQRILAEVKAELPPDKPYLKEKHLLAYARKLEEKKDRPLLDTVTPDLTIEYLGDLLDIFLKAGPQ
jgi:HAD superfamily hydrolase (TIGR01509 family)